MDNPESLSELSALVERTLVDTGRLFRQSASIPTVAHLQRSIPLYHESFQEALDNLSEQIFIAKAFLERDYEAIKAREVVPQSTKDVVMGGVDQILETQSPNAHIKDVSAEPGVEAKIEDSASVDVSAEVSDPIKAEPTREPSEDVKVKEESGVDSTAQLDQTFTDDGINFDSVLNDQGSNSFHLSLDFGDDDVENQAFLSGSAFGNTSNDKPDAVQQSAGPTTTTTDIPAGGGAFDMELSATGDSSAFPEGNSMDDMLGPGESSFDDLFMENENLDSGTGDLNQLEGDSLMNISELDDNWFV
ncbi:hypothetical protein N7495_002585 [Penicillium taxi]|uniref:uncharacterized protein n=1 Tax=Penicillium taxi TaxID=168475 RepID=UPI0025454A3E|nr:uncharacterized protein N7495_002585 [Penicillium taxi]KAJ5902057.1 hypothetical protein N7495_002585 [Penicillium taxi]